MFVNKKSIMSINNSHHSVFVLQGHSTLHTLLLLLQIQPTTKTPFIFPHVLSQMHSYLDGISKPIYDKPVSPPGLLHSVSHPKLHNNLSHYPHEILLFTGSLEWIIGLEAGLLSLGSEDCFCSNVASNRLLKEDGFDE